MSAGCRVAIRPSAAALAASMALVLAGPLSAQYLADNYIVNGTFDGDWSGWDSFGQLTWIGHAGSPDAGSLQMYPWAGATNTTRIHQCHTFALPAVGRYRLSARSLPYTTGLIVMVGFTLGPGCTGGSAGGLPIKAERVGTGADGWARLQADIDVPPSAASANISVVQIGNTSWVDTIRFGPLRDHQTVTGGAGNDYQASVAVPWGEADARVVVFERLDAGFSGDLLVTRNDDGETWSAPAPVVATAGNERHPALVQTGADAWSLFHLSNASGSFRIHRATSTDGATFSASVPVDLGWPAGSNQINPHVIRTPDGALTMTYHLLGGASFIARSTDNGASWDTLRTQVSPGNSALPRIAYRASDDTWLLAYQTGSNPVTLWVKTSDDPYAWSAPARQLTLDGNNHDAFPMLLADDSFVIAWARIANGAFQIFTTRSLDGVAWETPFQHTDRAGLANVQPHALPGPAAGTIELYWGAAQVPGDGNYDIARLPAAGVTDPLFADGFENP